MITKEQAVLMGDAWERKTLYHLSKKDSRGNPVKCRVNGKCKTWKKQPDKFRLPVKYGMYEFFYLDNDNADEWTAEEKEAI